MKSLLIGESANAEVEQAIVAALEDGPEVERVIHLRTLHLGPETLLVAAKIAVRVDQNAAAVVAGINRGGRRGPAPGARAPPILPGPPPCPHPRPEPPHPPAP